VSEHIPVSEHFSVNPGTTYAVAANPRSPKRLVAVGLISIREQNGDNRWRSLDTETVERGVEIMGNGKVLVTSQEVADNE